MNTVGHQIIKFYDDELTAVQLENGTIYVPIRPICAFIGADWATQQHRMLHDPVLKNKLISIQMITDENDAQTVNQPTLCLPFNDIYGFLLGIDANHVRSELKDKLLRYQRQCRIILAEAFIDGRLSTDDGIDAFIQSEPDSTVVQTYQMALAIMKQARERLLDETRKKNQSNTWSNLS